MMYTYTMILRWSAADQAWIVEVPDLPGAMADGATPHAAIEQAQIIIGEWIDTARELGREIPVPQSADLSASA
jgi:predicted RNase H-like HicB family nuclease